MKNLFSSIYRKLNSRFSFPAEGRFNLALKAFSDKEKQIFFIAMGIFVVSTVVMLIAVNREYLVKIPAKGGTIIEGVLTTPAHINPLLAMGETGSDADRDLTALIYSGLLRADGKGGFIPDLADHYEISDDGLTYTFTLKKDLTWHDGEKITASDIVFTVKTAQDSRTKSQKRASWDGVATEQIDDATIRFTLKKPYAPFLENTTMGILPKHIWETIDYNRFDANKYNREPIGSGPYKIKNIETTKKDGDEIPLSYTLTSFKDFALGEPYIKTIKFIFYRNENELVQALQTGTIDSINSISAEQANKLSGDGYHIVRTPLPRIIAVFFNQNEAPIFVDSTVRKALDITIDKQAIIDKVLHGYGTTINSPIPPGLIGYEKQKEDVLLSSEERLAKAREILTSAGWKWNEGEKTWSKKINKETQSLHFTLITSEATELKTIAQELKSAWDTLGVNTTIRVFTTGDLKETIVRPRKFDALFFGQVLGQSGDPYPFWHSSQRIDPGLNITAYANNKVDKILEHARTETNNEKRAEDYKVFQESIIKDAPAIFMYTPDFLYVVPENVRGFTLGSISTPSDRFLNVQEWYINTDNVWKIFVKNK